MANGGGSRLNGELWVWIREKVLPPVIVAVALASHAGVIWLRDQTRDNAAKIQAAQSWHQNHSALHSMVSSDHDAIVEMRSRVRNIEENQKRTSNRIDRLDDLLRRWLFRKGPLPEVAPESSEQGFQEFEREWWFDRNWAALIATLSAETESQETPQ